MNFGFRICCRPLADASHRHLRAAHGLLLRIRLDPLPQPPAGLDFGFATHRAGLFNAKTQRRKGAKSIHLPGFQRRGAETQRRRGDLTGFLRVARFRPSDGRKPLGRDTAPNTSVHLGVPAQRLALAKRRPRHFSSSFNSRKDCTPPPLTREKRGRTDVPRARRPVGSGTSTDARVRRRPSSHRRLAIRSPVVLPSVSSITFQVQHLSLCVSAPLRLCVSKIIRG